LYIINRLILHLVDRREIASWHRAFSKECPSGSLSLTQLQALYEQFFPFGSVSSFCHELCRLYDVDGDGKISFEEYLQAMSVTTRGRIEEKLRWAFRFYDHDGDGLLSRADLETVVKAVILLLEKSGEERGTWEVRVDQLLRTLSGTDTITWDQFREGVQNNADVLQSLLLYDGII